MSYGGSNPPWQRNSLGSAGQQGIPSLQSQMGLPNPNIGFQGNQSLFNQNLGINQHQQQGNISMIPPLTGTNVNSNQMFNQAISYPSSRGNLNVNAFAQSNNQQSNQNTQSNNQTCNKIGIVTKIQNDYGFIDEEIFFHKNSCEGTLPKVGDRVLVEATYSTNSAFKWNATLVHLVGAGTQNLSGRNQQQNNNPRTGSGYNAVPPPNAYASGFERPGQSRGRNQSPVGRRMSPERHSRNHESRIRDNDDEDRKRRREEREKEKNRVKSKHEHSIEKRDHSPIRRTSPKGRRNRVVPRYMVQVPKVTLDMAESDVIELRRRYANLYIPSDFFFTDICWPHSFPLNATFSLQKPCAFHIMHRSVETIKDNDSILDPPDADYIFSAKVMLMGIPTMPEVYRKCFSTAEEKEHDDDRNYVHPTRLISFLVGLQGKNEAMAIGGPWSAALDGPNPASDPSVLIKTAIRTCKALTGIDLNPCTQWYRFVELYYRRSESVRKGRTIPARVETVVIYLPDVRSCVPTRIEWDGLQSGYKQKLEQIIKQSESDGVAVVSAPKTSDNPKIDSNEKFATGGTGDVAGAAVGAVVATAVGASGGGGDADGDGDAANEKNESDIVKREPTHFADLDPKTMKISNLRDELEARNLSSKGLKPQLIARLTKVLKAEENDANLMEQDNEENEQLDENNGGNDDGELDMTDIIVIDEYDSTKCDSAINKAPVNEEPKPMDERERRLLEKRYQLPDNPQLIIHPSRTAKSGKFFCNVMSLSILLDYRQEDTKEHSFEVSLFAELFNEMLMRDFGFNIYKALHALPEKPKENEKDEEKDGKKENKKKSDDEPKDKKIKKDEENKGDNENSSTKSKEDIAVKTNSDKEKSNDKTNDSDKDKKSAKDKDKERRKRKEDETDDENFSIKSGDPKKKEKDRQKYYTADPDLLLSFVYFDQTHCGYIFEKDIENLFYTLGLNLSRAQTRKLISKVVSRDSLLYRKLTDKPRDEKTDTMATPCETGNGSNELVNCNLDEVSKGNKMFMPIFRRNLTDSNHPVKRLRADSEENGQVQETTGMVTYQGGMIDINKLMEQMRRSEKARDDTEQLLVDLRKSNADLTASNTRAKEKIKDLQSDVKSYSRKLGDVEQTLSSTTKNCSEYHSILSTIHDRVEPIFIKAERSSSKSDSSREKEREKRDRDRDEHRDKEKEKEDKNAIKTEIKIEDK